MPASPFSVPICRAACASFCWSASISFAGWFGALNGFEGDGSGGGFDGFGIVEEVRREEGRVVHLPSVDGRVEDVVIVFEPTSRGESVPQHPPGPVPGVEGDPKRGTSRLVARTCSALSASMEL